MNISHNMSNPVGKAYYKDLSSGVQAGDWISRICYPKSIELANWIGHFLPGIVAASSSFTKMKVKGNINKSQFLNLEQVPFNVDSHLKVTYYLHSFRIFRTTPTSQWASTE